MSFLLEISITRSFCFFSKKGTPCCLTTFLKEQFETINVIKIIYNNLTMDNNFLNVYNTLVKYTRNKDLYISLNRPDNFSDRLIFLLLHFAFFLRTYKNDKNRDLLQKLYDFIFRQLELSIREIGYGDQSINKKMKDYLNHFHHMVSEIHFWHDLNKSDKIKLFSIFLEDFNKIDDLVDYFDGFNEDLRKKNLNSFLKSVKNE